MELLCTCKKMDKVYFLIPLKYLVLIFFIWIYHTCNDVVPGKTLEKIYKHEKILNQKFNRLLAKHDIKRELEHTRLRERLPDRRSYKGERNVYDNLSAYSGVKSKASNNIDIYMKNYKKRYMRKKGLSKLDCYCENKVFGKFCHIRDIAEKLQNDRKSSKRFFIKKYGIGLFLLALIPALGLIYPILLGKKNIGNGILDICFTAVSGTHNQCGKLHPSIKEEDLVEIAQVVFAYSIITLLIVLILIIYLLIKVIKYEKIKAGKGKMNIKEYCRFCKDIL